MKPRRLGLIGDTSYVFCALMISIVASAEMQTAIPASLLMSVPLTESCGAHRRRRCQKAWGEGPAKVLQRLEKILRYQHHATKPNTTRKQLGYNKQSHAARTDPLKHLIDCDLPMMQSSKSYGSRPFY